METIANRVCNLIEKGFTIEESCVKIGIDRNTLYRQLTKQEKWLLKSLKVCYNNTMSRKLDFKGLKEHVVLDMHKVFKSPVEVDVEDEVIVHDNSSIGMQIAPFVGDCYMRYVADVRLMRKVRRLGF